MPAAIDPMANSGRNSPKPPPARIWNLAEPPFEGIKPVDTEGYKRSSEKTAIVIDFGTHPELGPNFPAPIRNTNHFVSDPGSSNVRAGWSFDKNPRLSLPPLMARYRDRKLNRTFMFVGSDIYSDGTARGQAKHVYEPGSNVVNNWDAVEGVLDYVFVKLGINSDTGIQRPVVMTEPVANLGYSHKSMKPLCFVDALLY
jgi:actin-related protein 5